MKNLALPFLLLSLILPTRCFGSPEILEDCNSKDIGYIDAAGTLVIPPSFVEAYGFHDGIAVARTCTGGDVSTNQGNL